MSPSLLNFVEAKDKFTVCDSDIVLIEDVTMCTSSQVSYDLVCMFSIVFPSNETRESNLTIARKLTNVSTVL